MKQPIKKSKTLTKEQFISRARAIHGDKYDYSNVEYKSMHTKVIIICNKHGEFLCTPNNHINGRGCPKCKNENTGNRCRNNLEKFIEKAKQIHGNKYNYSKSVYKSLADKITITCPIHGDFEQIARNHLHGAGCIKCSRHLITTEEFINRSNEIHNFRYDYNKTNYKSWTKKVIITCLEHGDFCQQPGNHLHGTGCPKCILKSQTKVFEKLSTEFPDENILFEVNNQSVKWLEQQRFDIYFPKYNIAVEYDGRQHFVPIKQFGGIVGLENTVERDKKKNKLCQENNCHLFRLKYDYTEQDFQNLVLQIKEIINK